MLLEMKCPQLSKPEATAARNQNSIGDRTEKKTLGGFCGSIYKRACGTDQDIAFVYVF